MLKKKKEEEESHAGGTLLHHLRGEEVQLRAVEPLAALLTALQRLVPGDEDGAAHRPRAHGHLGEERPRFAGLEDKHCGGGNK